MRISIIHIPVEIWRQREIGQPMTKNTCQYDSVCCLKANAICKQVASLAVIALSAVTSSASFAQLADVSANFLEIGSQIGLANYQANGSTIHGPGTVFADLNNDGYPDIYAVDNAGNDLYINVPSSNGGREFQLVGGAAGANPGANSSSAAPGDYDNDGDLDLFVAVFGGSNFLYKNMLIETGNLQFQNVTGQTVPSNNIAGTTQSGLAQAFDNEGLLLSRSYTASWGDVDRDGFLDLYVGSHNGVAGNGPLIGGIAGMRDTLYLNQGNGTFLDVTEVYNVTGASGPNGEFEDNNQRYNSTMATMFVDINNDRWPDLIVTNKTFVNSGPIDTDQLYLNRGVNAQGVWLGFDNVTYSLPGGFTNTDYSVAPMSIVVADIDNDGDLDFVYSDDSATEIGGTPGTVEIHVNQLSETGQLGFTVDHTSVPSGFSWGTVFEDFDNNGFEDLFVAGADCCTRGFNQPDWLYMNAFGFFTEQTIQANFISNLDSDGRANASADFDRDGWPDLLQVYNDGTPVSLYHNRAAVLHPERRSVSIKLVGDPNSPSPFVSSVDAIGARATLTADINGDNFANVDDSERQIREVASGYNVMSSTSSLELEFGMGLASSGTLMINWPSGRTTTDTVTAGQHYIRNETGGLSILDIGQAQPPGVPPTSSFVPCAVENAVCSLPGPATVRYGANGQYVEQSFDGGNVACTNEVFGDPINGTVKSCEFRLTPVPGTFTLCALENGVCSLPGPATVRYGANGQYFEQVFAGGNVACTNDVFGDPINGTLKACEFQLTSEPTNTPPNGFVSCAIEGGTCALPGPAIIRYGAEGQYFQQTFTGGSVPCSNSVFGDPINGTVKSCEYQLTSAANAACAIGNELCVLP